MTPHKIDIHHIIDPFIERVDTRRVVLETQLLPRAAETLRQSLPAGLWIVLSDANTHQVAGRAVEESLERDGLPFERVTLSPKPGEHDPIADDDRIEELRLRLVEDPRPVALVAVGAGTINDVAKMACHKANIPYAVVATAPSMNGYTSAIAAILSQGVKTTVPCRAPILCMADLDVMAQSPYRMIASGFGDLLSKPVSNADWRLSHRLLDTVHSADTMALVEQGFAFLEGVAPRLPLRDVDAVGRLTATLCISGMAMAVAGSSAPASGGEHLISHYIDMTHFAFGDPHDFHGCQVGVATITTAALYEKLTALDPDTIDIETLIEEHLPLDQYEALTRSRFGPLSEAVIEHMRALYPTPDTLRQRLGLLKKEWASIIEDVNGSLKPARAIRDDLLAAHCPVTFEEINVAPERARAAIVCSKDIRARYSILHLAFDLGLIDTWADEILNDLHGI